MNFLSQLFLVKHHQDSEHVKDQSKKNNLRKGEFRSKAINT